MFTIFHKRCDQKPARRVWLSLLAAVLALSGCANRIAQPDLAERMYREHAEAKPAQAAPVPDFISEELLSGPVPRAASRPATSRRFDVSVHDIPAKAFFVSLVADAGVNVVAHPDVTGALSLELKNVTVEEVLNVVRDVYGYEYRFRDGIYTILPRALRTEIFPINYIDITRVGVTDTSVSIGEIRSSGGSSGSPGAASPDTSSANILAMAGGMESAGGQGISPGSRVQTLNKTDFWRSLQETLNAIVGAPREGRMVMVNAQAGLVVVHAMPGELSSVREFLERSELSVRRQVVLETQILEVRLSEGFEAGINWGEIQGQLQYTNRVTAISGATDIIGWEKPGNEVFASIFKIVDVRDLLSLLETQGQVQVLSSPRVSTVNNQKAVIRVGSDEFFVTGIKNNTTASAAATTNSPEIELASFFSGISLDVTPQISESGDVILHIHPIVSDVRDQQKDITVGDARFTLPLAFREIRESDSIVRARSGQVVVLGGLMQESTRNMHGRRPLLGDVPVLGNVFRTRQKARSKTELVILLRPVVVDDETWGRQIDQLQGLSESMRSDMRPRSGL